MKHKADQINQILSKGGQSIINDVYYQMQDGVALMCIFKLFSDDDHFKLDSAMMFQYPTSR